MEQHTRIDKILDAIEARVQDEVSALLGAEFTLDSGNRKLAGKGAVVEGLLGKQVCVHLEMSGDVVGTAHLFMGIKDAIRLGGTLIMLPDSELQEVIGREEYREEIADSFSEIANIVAGAISHEFEEMYPKSCRFVRREQELVTAAKVVVESASPIDNHEYYLASLPMMIDGRQLGDLLLLLPAAPFGLASEAAGPQPAEAEAPDMQAPGDTGEQLTEDVTPEDAPAAGEDSPGNHPEPRQIDFYKQRKKIDRILDECQRRLTLEIGALLGVDIQLDDLDNRMVGKSEFFTQATGRQVMAEMAVVGDSQDTCYFTVSLKDAIHLGGILIMLPPAELANVVSEEEFTEDTTDAYGEVANIVSGVYSSVFEEQYYKKLRFIRKQLKQVVPSEVATASDEPMPDRPYYVNSMSLTVEGTRLGQVHMLFPADLLQLEPPRSEKTARQNPTAGAEQNVAVPGPAADDRRPAAPETAAAKPGPAPAGLPGAALAKHRERVDKLLALCREKMQSEVSALLDLDFQLSDQVNTVIGKEPFFSDFVSGKQVIVDMDVVGELAGTSYLAVNLRDAIRIGGSLIMLPKTELEAVIADEELGEDTKDAFGEIANIIAGVYTGVFEEQYTQKLRFIKADLHQVVPMKVEVEAAEPMPNGEYYLSTMELTMAGMPLGKVNALFPLELLQLEGLTREVEPVEEEVADHAARPAGSPAAGEGRNEKPPQPVPDAPDVLLIGDDEAEAVKIEAVLAGMGLAVRRLTFKDTIHSFLPGQVKAIYLIMKEVNEQAFGAAIKVSSACSLPLIAAGPGWTRTKVIKAVKYGVRDILLTPAGKADIEENVTNNLMRLAA